jgi:hypothetical protein
VRRIASLASASLLALVGLACNEHDNQGPLGDRGDVRAMTSGSVPAGTTYVIGVNLPENASGVDTILESIEPSDSGRASGLEMRYAAVHVPNRGCQVGSAHGWPPLRCAGKAKPVGGFRFGNGRSVEILVGALAGSPGHWVIPDFRLRYSVGGRHYAATYAQGMNLRVRPASTKFVFFRTPSRNIGCAWSTLDLTLRCDIRTGVKPPPAKPKGCENDWTFGYEMSPAGRARVVCAGDTVLSSGARVIGYGGTWRGGPHTCKSRRSGLRCRNRTGRGFFLSRRHSYRF